MVVEVVTKNFFHCLLGLPASRRLSRGYIVTALARVAYRGEGAMPCVCVCVCVCVCARARVFV